MLQYYFSDDAEDYIPGIGEWMLKVTCLHVGEPPKESNYSKAVDYLLRSGAGGKELKDVFKDLDWALRRAEGFGAATDKMVPSQPVLHVLSALRSQYLEIKESATMNVARRLLKAYYWRCLFSNRHAVQANDRLYEDYRQLSSALDAIGGDLPNLSAFDEQDHPLFDQDHLMRHAGWIGSSRLGRALAAAVMARDPKPVEWMTGVSLSATEIRELQSLRKLDRHHVFPKAALADGGVDEDLIDSGLNGVVLDRRTNLRLWKVSPREYVDKMLNDKTLKKIGVGEIQLKRRIESHLVPFTELKNKHGDIHRRYKRYLQKRAKLMAEMIEDLASPP